MQLPSEWTPVNLSQTPAARRLDGMIAEKVMGWARPSRPYQPWDKRPDVPGVMLCRQHELPPFCTDIRSAWDVVEKLRERFTIDVSIDSESANVRIFTGDRYELLPGAVRDLAFVEAPTAPMAICLAALKAVENQVASEGVSEPAENVAEIHELIARLDEAARRAQANRESATPRINRH